MLRAGTAAVVAALLVAGLLHAVAGVDLLGHLHWALPCPFRAVTGVPCPGCGMTRAFLLLSQLRLGEAFAAHPAAPLLLAVLCGRVVGGSRGLGLPAEALARASAVAVIALWLVRL